MSDISKSAGDAELQEFLLVEKQKAQVNEQVGIFSILLWDWIKFHTWLSADSQF